MLDQETREFLKAMSTEEIADIIALYSQYDDDSVDDEESEAEDE